MDIALLGASGDCGRAIAGQLVEEGLLAPTERLQLVGRSDGASARVLHGLVSDLSDAYAERVPDLDVVLSPDDVVADLWIVAAGITMPIDRTEADRTQLATVNASVFRAYADALARNGQGTEIVIVVSNPVELGVAIFAEAIGRRRVVGIGAYQDSLRFRREIAADLGVRRQRVSGFILGEHGDAQAPIWSSVQVHGFDASELSAAIASLRKGTELSDFARLCADQRLVMAELLDTGRVAEAFARLDTLPPDIRVVVKPYVTHMSGSKTVLATANVTVDLVRTLVEGREVLIAGQVLLTPEDDFYGLTGPLGVPVIVGPGGVSRVVTLPLTESERLRMQIIAARVNEKWMTGDGPR